MDNILSVCHFSIFVVTKQKRKLELNSVGLAINRKPVAVICCSMEPG